MVHHNRFFILALLPILLLAGCADDNTPEAKRVAAQKALDKGDCQTAITLFSELQAGDSESVARRLDLSAAYLCQAGFSVQGFLKVVANSNGGEIGTSTLLADITEQVSTLIPNTEIWQANVCKSKALLGEVDKTTWPCRSLSKVGTSTPSFFKDDKDAGYILSIVNLADTVLTITDVLNVVQGIAECVQQEGVQTGQITCNITTDDLFAVVNSLLFAKDAAVAATGQGGGELSGTIDSLVSAADLDDNKELSNAEVLNYLVTQGTLKDPTVVGVPANCTYTQNPIEYTCAE